MPPERYDPDWRQAELARRGDRDALGALYERHKGRLLGFLLRATGRGRLAEDVFQDVWVKVMKAIGNYNPEKAPFRAWLYRVAANAAIDRLRSEALHRTTSTADPPGEDSAVLAEIASPEPGPEQQGMAREMDRRLAVSLRRLPDRQRLAILLRHQQGLSYPEIAAALGVPEGTAKTMVHRGVLHLRKWLQPETGGGR